MCFQICRLALAAQSHKFSKNMTPRCDIIDTARRCLVVEIAPSTTQALLQIYAFPQPFKNPNTFLMRPTRQNMDVDDEHNHVRGNQSGDKAPSRDNDHIEHNIKSSKPILLDGRTDSSSIPGVANRPEARMRIRPFAIPGVDLQLIRMHLLEKRDRV